MKMKKTDMIVVPVDFSEITGKLVDYALYMAGKLGAKVHFVHAVHFYPGDAMFGAPFAQECEGKLLSGAEKLMSNLIDDNKGRGREVTGEVVIGEPVDRLVETAKDKAADMIIISTHGAKGLEKILLGSVAERVVKRAHCPVLFMNPFKEQ
jgi:nucleotide-binding universal stress UspA family protein